MTKSRLKLVHSKEEKVSSDGWAYIDMEGATITEALLDECYRRVVGNPRLMHDKKNDEWVEMKVIEEEG